MGTVGSRARPDQPKVSVATAMRGPSISPGGQDARGTRRDGFPRGCLLCVASQGHELALCRNADEEDDLRGGHSRNRRPPFARKRTGHGVARLQPLIFQDLTTCFLEGRRRASHSSGLPETTAATLSRPIFTWATPRWDVVKIFYKRETRWRTARGFLVNFEPRGSQKRLC